MLKARYIILKSNQQINSLIKIPRIKEEEYRSIRTGILLALCQYKLNCFIPQFLLHNQVPGKRFQNNSGQHLLSEKLFPPSYPKKKKKRTISPLITRACPFILSSEIHPLSALCLPSMIKVVPWLAATEGRKIIKQADGLKNFFIPYFMTAQISPPNI